MRQMVEKILRFYGTGILLRHGSESCGIRAFFQPVRSKSWQNMEHAVSALGETARGQYIFMGPVEPEAHEGDILSVGGKEYLLRRTEIIYDSEGPVYCWGLCMEKGRDDTWGQV